MQFHHAVRRANNFLNGLFLWEKNMTIQELTDLLKGFDSNLEIVVQYYNPEASGSIVDNIKAIALDCENPQCILLTDRDWT